MFRLVFILEKKRNIKTGNSPLRDRRCKLDMNFFPLAHSKERENSQTITELSETFIHDYLYKHTSQLYTTFENAFKFKCIYIRLSR